MNERKDTAIEAFQRLREAIEKAGPRNMAPRKSMLSWRRRGLSDTSNATMVFNKGAGHKKEEATKASS